MQRLKEVEVALYLVNILSVVKHPRVVVIQ